MNIDLHLSDKTQSDYKNGAIDIRTTDPKDCFALGEVMERLVCAGFEVVHGDYGQGKFIRLPLINHSEGV